MSSRAVIIHTNPGDQQKWSTPHSCALAVVVVIFVVMAGSGLWAQTSTTGAIAGIVTDPTAAVMSGVSITLKNADTGIPTSTTTNSQGSYNFTFLQPGNYSVSATAAGFQQIAKNVTVALGSSVTANLQLSISSQSQTEPLALGLIPGSPYASERVSYAPSDLFLMLTDGITEVVNERDEDFGLGRLEQLLSQHAAQPLWQLWDLVMHEVKQHGVQQDDQTLLLIRILE